MYWIFPELRRVAFLENCHHEYVHWIKYNVYSYLIYKQLKLKPTTVQFTDTFLEVGDQALNSSTIYTLYFPGKV